MREDLAHDYGVNEPCDQAGVVAALRAGEDVDGECAAQQFCKREREKIAFRAGT